MVFPVQLEDTTPLRAWLVADGAVVPAIAKPPDITITSDCISLSFLGGGAELYAISIGSLYKVDETPAMYAEAETYLHGVKGQLHLLGKTGRIMAQDETTSAIAYLPAKGEAQGVSIVSQITGTGQLTIAEGGIIEVSSDLAGKHIKFAKFPVIQPPAVSISQEQFKHLEAKIVCADNDEFYLASIPADRIPSSQHIEQERRRIELVYLHDRTTFHLL
jgi:hypothetical protein